MSVGPFGEGGRVENAGDVSLKSGLSPVSPEVVSCDVTEPTHPLLLSKNICSGSLAEVKGTSG